MLVASAPCHLSLPDVVINMVHVKSNETTSNFAEKIIVFFSGHGLYTLLVLIIFVIIKICCYYYYYYCHSNYSNSLGGLV